MSSQVSQIENFHVIWLFKSRFWIVRLVILLSLFNIGCNPIDPQPELKDKIYNDYLANWRNSEKKILELQKEIDKLKEDRKKISAYESALKMINTKQTRSKQLEIASLQSKVEYYRIRQNQRAVDVRIEYLRAREAGIEWQPNRVYKEYEQVKKARAIPLEWDRRVPKTTRYNKRAPAAVVEKKKK